MTTYRKTCLALLGLIAGTIPASRTAFGEPFATAFTYQAQLNEGNGPLNGSADFRFKLFAVESSGVQVGDTFTIADLAVLDGLVAERLDFGVDVFDGGSRWLEVAIRTPHDPSDAAPFTTLSPRQAIAPIPYALQTRGIFVDEAGVVSIGSGAVAAGGASRGDLPAPSQFNVTATVPGRAGLLAESTATTGDSVGIKGKTASLAGRGIEGTGPGEGVRGAATATVGDVVGVKGTTDSINGKGIEGIGPAKGMLGHATGKTGAATGVHGLSDSPDGEGIRGEATAGSGVARGVSGISSSPTGEGVVGHASAKSGSATGVRGMSDAPDGTGVVGQAIGNGIGVVGQSDTEGVRGVANAVSGQAMGVCGMSASMAGAGVYGLASSGIGVNTGVKGASNSPEGIGVFGSAPNEGVRGELTSIGPETTFGVLGRAIGTSATGVYGETHSASGSGYGDGYGVHGRAFGLEKSAGVLAEGDGTEVPGPPESPRAAALEIRNGAIRVSGEVRPAGTIPLPSGGFTSISSCTSSGPASHSHNIGFQQEVSLFSDLILDNSIILATVEVEDSEGPNVSYAVHVRNKHPGSVIFRVTAIGTQGGACPPPSDTISRSVHYLIINPCSEPATECDANPRGVQR